MSMLRYASILVINSCSKRGTSSLRSCRAGISIGNTFSPVIQIAERIIVDHVFKIAVCCAIREHQLESCCYRLRVQSVTLVIHVNEHNLHCHWHVMTLIKKQRTLQPIQSGLYVQYHAVNACLFAKQFTQINLAESRHSLLARKALNSA